jgi:uncharacterized BrkB/YihY/UPF0761 family membrane protein
VRLNQNEAFVACLAFMGCVFGLAIQFMPNDKASIYVAIPGGVVTLAATYLGTQNKKDD